MKRKRDLVIAAALVLGLWALPCWGQGENPPAAQAGKTSGHGYTAVEQTPGYSRMSTLNEIKQLSQEYDDALMKEDLATLDRLIADDYVSQSAASGTANKEQYLNNLRNGVVRFDAVRVSNQQIHLYGDSTAVQTATVHLSGQSKAKGEFNGDYQVMRVWVNRSGRWQTVSFQSTPISGTQSAAKE